MKKHKNFSRKEIREDKLITFYSKFSNFYREHTQYFQIALGVVAVIVVLVIIMQNQAAIENEEASLELSRMMSVYNAGSYSEAIEGRPGTTMMGLRKVASEYDGTAAGEAAKIFLGNSLYFLNKYQEAIDVYEDYSGENPLHKAASYSGIGACYEAMKNYENAADYYEKAANVKEHNILNAEYLVNAGVMYLKTDNHDKAKELFNTVKKEYKGNQFAQTVEQYLAQVN